MCIGVVLFAEFIVLMHYLYIKLKRHPSVRHADNSLGTADIDISTQSSSYFKFVTASQCGNQVAFCSGLKTKN